MNYLKPTYQFLFFTGVFFLPFNSQVPKWLSFLGEYSGDSSPFFFLLAFISLVSYQILTGKIYFPFSSKIYQFLLVFMAVIIVSTLFNIVEITGYYFKQTPGIVRFIRQFISFAISAIIFFYLFINVCRDYGVERFFLKVRKLFLITFIIVFIYAVLEYLITKFQLLSLYPLITPFDYLPFVKVKLNFNSARLSSLTYEPPALGTYLITIAGFLFTYILTSKKKIRYIPFLLIVFLAIISGSRTALVVVSIQCIIAIVFTFYMLPGFRKGIRNAAIISIVALIPLVIFFGNDIYNSAKEKIESLDFTRIDNKTDVNSISNKSRIGIQVAMLEVVKEKPILGTGWGQQAYESIYHYPRWAMQKNYEFSALYLNEKITSFPPGYNLYLRILVESGILGLLVFLFFLTAILKAAFSLYKNHKETLYISIALIISFVGSMMNWFQIDSFRLYGFWLCLAILILYKKDVKG